MADFRLRREADEARVFGNSPCLDVQFQAQHIARREPIAGATCSMNGKKRTREAMKQQLLIFVLAALSLCASIASASVWSNITCDFGKDADTGLVILSGSLPNAFVGQGVPISVSFRYNGVGKSNFAERGILLDRKAGLFKSAPSDFDEHYGRLFVLQFKAGDYEFKGWTFKDAANVDNMILGLPSLPFRVEAGRATYLGSFSDNLRVVGKNRVGQVVSEAPYRVIDNQARDLKVFAQKCPSFDAALIDVRVLDSSSWSQ